MKPTTLKILILVILFTPFATTVARARDVKLDWKGAVALAKEKNFALKAASDTSAAAHSRLTSSKWAFGPTLSLQSGYTRTELGSPASVNETASTTATVDQSLLNFAKFSTITANEAITKRQDEALRIQALTVVRDLKKALADLVFARDRLELAKSALASRQRNLDLVRLRFQGGRENKGSVLLSQANVELAQVDLFDAERAIRTAQDGVRAVLGLDASDTIIYSGDLPVSFVDETVEPTSLAVNAPEYFVAIAREEEASAAIGVARGALLPSLSATASTGRYGDRPFEGSNGWSVGATLKIPLFDVSSYQSVSAARADASASTATREALQRDLVSRISTARATVASAEKRVTLAKDFQEAAQVRAVIAREQYKNGLTTFDEWDRIESDLINRQVASLESIRDRVRAGADWDLLIGAGERP